LTNKANNIMVNYIAMTLKKNMTARLRKSQSILKQAFKQGVLTHVAIDLQAKYLSSRCNQENHDVFEAVAKTSEFLRTAGVKTVWVAKTTSDKLTRSDKLYLVKPEKDEMLFLKPEESACSNPDFTDYLTEHFKVALISGLTSYCCVKVTVEDLHARGIQPIIICDATDAPYRDRSSMEQFTKNKALYISQKELTHQLGCK